MNHHAFQVKEIIENPHGSSMVEVSNYGHRSYFTDACFKGQTDICPHPGIQISPDCDQNALSHMPCPNLLKAQLK